MKITLLSILIVSMAGLLLPVFEAAYSDLPKDVQLLSTDAPKVLLKDFEYMPTKDGYRFSYQLADGTRREEIGIIGKPGDSIESLLVVGDGEGDADNDYDDSSTITTGTAARTASKPKTTTATTRNRDVSKSSDSRRKPQTKTRKLALKTLQSLAG